ncbi:hypothetical protein HZH68_008413 [Vespula germanica]|uniref:Uncharacterized protein n=1 Tax=Vespula germanica TaxID=30212 RepID=A0A834K620_VESGE|nr:hypothetical protein HZH68_008413 [Vespula germanica]
MHSDSAHPSASMQTTRLDRRSISLAEYKEEEEQEEEEEEEGEEEEEEEGEGEGEKEARGRRAKGPEFSRQRSLDSVDRKSMERRGREERTQSPELSCEEKGTQSQNVCY